MKKVTICAASAVALMASAAQADVLLEVDLSVVDQITITATNGLSAVDVSGSNGIGVYFENFYGAPAGGSGDTLVSGDLTSANNPSDSSPDLFSFGSDPGLNIFSWSTDGTVSFTAGSVAFTGSGTWSLTSTAYAEMLAGNTSGDLYFAADNLPDLPNASVIGTYRVVPAPGAFALLGLGGLTCARRRRA